MTHPEAANFDTWTEERYRDRHGVVHIGHLWGGAWCCLDYYDTDPLPWAPRALVVTCWWCAVGLFS